MGCGDRLCAREVVFGMRARGDDDARGDAETRDAGRGGDNILLALSARSAGRVWVSSSGREGRVRT